MLQNLSFWRALGNDRQVPQLSFLSYVVFDEVFFLLEIQQQICFVRNQHNDF